MQSHGLKYCNTGVSSASMAVKAYAKHTYKKSEYMKEIVIQTKEIIAQLLR